MLNIPCGTKNTEFNRDKYIALLEPGEAIILNNNKSLECVPANKLSILKLVYPDLKIVYE